MSQMGRVVTFDLDIDLEAGPTGADHLRSIGEKSTASSRTDRACMSVPVALGAVFIEVAKLQPAIVRRRTFGKQTGNSDPKPAVAEDSPVARRKTEGAYIALPKSSDPDVDADEWPVSHSKTQPAIARQRTLAPAPSLLGRCHHSYSLQSTGARSVKLVADAAARLQTDGCCPGASQGFSNDERALCPPELELSSKATGTLWGAFANLVVTCVGSTLVLVPALVAELGMGGATLALLAPALLSAMTMRMLVHLADASLAGDYAGVMRDFLGRGGDLMAFGGLVFMLPLVAASCLAFVIELVPQMTTVSPGAACLAALAVAAPFACTSSLQRLGHASEFALAGIGYTILLIAFQVLLGGGGHSVVDRPLRSSSANMVIIMLSQGLSAFGAEIGVIQSYLEVSEAKRVYFKRWVVDTSLVAILGLYVAVGALGYALYGDGVEPNVLLSLDDSIWSGVAKVMVVLGNVLRAPLFCVLFYVTISSKFPMLFDRFSGRPFVRMTVQCGCLLVAAVLSLVLGSVGILISIVGGTAAVGLCQVMPSLAWLMARRQGKVERQIGLDAGAILMAIVLPLFAVAFVMSLAMELAMAA